MAFYYKKFKTLRKDKGMSQIEVAQKLGLAKSTIAMYESGKRTPDFETIEAICDLFNVNLSELSDSKLAVKYEDLTKNSDTPAYYLDPETAEMAEQLHKRKDMRMLFHAAKSSTPEDVKMVTDMLERFKNS